MTRSFLGTTTTNTNADSITLTVQFPSISNVAYPSIEKVRKEWIFSSSCLSATINFKLQSTAEKCKPNFKKVTNKWAILIDIFTQCIEHTANRLPYDLKRSEETMARGLRDFENDNSVSKT